MAKTPKPVASAVASASPKKYKDDDWRKIVAVLIIIVGGIIALMVVGVSKIVSGPKSVSDQLVANIQASDDRAAYALFSPAAMEVTPKDDFAKLVDRISPILNSPPKTVNSEISLSTAEGSSSKIVYEIKGNDGKTYAISVYLVRQNDQWKVQSFSSIPK